MQRRMAQTLAAIYGQPPPGLVSGEGVGLLSAGLALRYATQQLVRLAPGVGWLLSGVLSGVSTWLLGRTLLLHYSRALPMAAVVERTGALCRARGADLVKWALTSLRRVRVPRTFRRHPADGRQADERSQNLYKFACGDTFPEARSFREGCMTIRCVDELDSSGGAP